MFTEEDSSTINPTQDGPFRGSSQMGDSKKIPPPPFPKMRHTYSTIIKLGTVIPYLKNIQKIYMTHIYDTTFEFC